MTDHDRSPDPNSDELDVTTRLGAVARFNPRPGFHQRVLAQVRHPLPRWARRWRDWSRGLVSGVRGWVILGSLSLATAAAWTVAIGVGVRFHTYVIRGVDAAGAALAPLWQEALSSGLGETEAVLADVAGGLEVMGLSWQAVAIGYGALILVCAVVLRQLMTRPGRVRIQR